MKKHNRIIFHHQGFTLVELMITIAISSLIIAAMYASYILQQRSYNIQGAVVEAQQNARVAMDFLTLDLRMAGYNPIGGSGATVTAATANSIAFTADMDESGTIGTLGTPATQNETFSYDLNTHTVNGVNIPTFRRSATMNGTTSLQPMADYIEQVEFCYQLDDGTLNQNPANPGDIRAIYVTMLARAPRPDSNYVNNESYRRGPCNPPPPPPAVPVPPAVWDSSTWGAAGANFRRRVITTHIDLRNMGL